MLETALSVLKGEYFHAVDISGFIDFGWTVKLTDHEGEEFIYNDKELARAILGAWVKWAGRIKNDEFRLIPDGDKTD